ncbi:hypothetical protein NCAS_0G02290 [Naumovozyma castellii]|uniref:Small ribosomal subunit protein uS4m n=1 Tax=Naumovozyma castellii TaxID=27288 RepID=G0VI81_NAUCA|nr:hypothetical protein NCAS_0G02290 [Naumovozyma castellii CBS 4309]CCC71116.1 hypothetical protein NCAS_0G02290 [Naumovozyma castellii CBS 4309]
MPRKATLLNSLSRGRIRTSYNKYNFFNLYKKSKVDFKSKTLFQQKWTAKQETRAYHGEHITEGRWQQFFDPKLASVAQLDASLRRSASSKPLSPTPFLLQTYAVLEKRLDFALFRAMFASSVRQARQFILHGYVKVNGVVIKHPGMTLKPGDLFSVKPAKVLQAMGAKKLSLLEALKVDKKQVVLWNKYVKEAKENSREVWNKKMEKFKDLDENDPKKIKFMEFLKMYNKSLESAQYNDLKNCSPEYFLNGIISIIAKEGSNTLSAKNFESIVEKDIKLSQEVFKCYQDLLKLDELAYEQLKEKKPAELKELAHKLMSPSKNNKEALSESSKKSIRTALHQLSTLTKQYETAIIEHYKTIKASENTSTIPFDPQWAQRLQYHDAIKIEELQEDEKKAQQAINLPWQRHVFGRQEPSKPYFTPWKPRPFLAPLAILPHHLEISFKTCNAVYLRDPVARPGHSEVISPFDIPIHERAYMYYIRKGK